MAWVKQQKVKQDFYLAKDDFNQMQQNELEMHDTLLGAEHENDANSQNSYAPFGGHDHKRFPKAVARIGVYVSGSFVQPWADIASGVYGFVERQSTGKYRVQVRNSGTTNTLYPFTFAPAETTGTALRDILSVFNSGATNGNSFIGYELTLLEWDSVSSSWELADFDFGIAAYSMV